MSREIGILDYSWRRRSRFALLALERDLRLGADNPLSLAGASTVGTVTVNAQGAGKGISGGSPVRPETAVARRRRGGLG